MTSSVYVAGVGMIPFTKPGANAPYLVMGAEATALALKDAGISYDMIQQALTTAGSVSPGQLYAGVGQFLALALVYMTVAVLNLFFVRHYVFRWRTAMNDYFTAYWARLRHIEGASQRVQEDTKLFSRRAEGLGVELFEAVMTLIAFLPVLLILSASITELPLVGEIPYPLVVNAGLKGPAVAALAAKTKGPVAFIDDLLPNLDSVAADTPHARTFQMVADKRLRPLAPCSPDRHRRIDDWADLGPAIEAAIRSPSART